MAKTTLEIADVLMIRAKKKAADLQRPLKSVVESALRLYLKDVSGFRASRSEPKKIRWHTVDGGVPQGLDLTDRSKMHEWFKKQK